MKDGQKIKCKNINSVFYGNGSRRKKPSKLSINKQDLLVKDLSSCFLAGRIPPQIPTRGRLKGLWKLCPYSWSSPSLPPWARAGLWIPAGPAHLDEHSTVPGVPGAPCQGTDWLLCTAPRTGLSPLQSWQSWAEHSDLPLVQGISAGILLPFTGSWTMLCQEAQPGISKEHRLPRQGMECPSLGIFQEHWTQSWAVCFGVPYWSWSWDQRTHCAPLQPDPSCDTLQ